MKFSQKEIFKIFSNAPLNRRLANKDAYTSHDLLFSFNIFSLSVFFFIACEDVLNENDPKGTFSISFSYFQFSSTIICVVCCQLDLPISPFNIHLQTSYGESTKYLKKKNEKRKEYEKKNPKGWSYFARHLFNH